MDFCLPPDMKTMKFFDTANDKYLRTMSRQEFTELVQTTSCKGLRKVLYYHDCILNTPVPMQKYSRTLCNRLIVVITTYCVHVSQKSCFFVSHPLSHYCSLVFCLFMGPALLIISLYKPLYAHCMLTVCQSPILKSNCSRANLLGCLLCGFH